MFYRWRTARRTVSISIRIILQVQLAGFVLTHCATMISCDILFRKEDQQFCIM